MNDYYVYVYYDPRNYKLFYVGKGKGGRKQSHLRDFSKSQKVEIIKAIELENLDPIIKVIAKDLSEDEALLIESTLIWEHFDSLSNKVKGNYSKHFRPLNTMHRDIQGFDYKNNIYYVNVGEGDTRDWIDCKKFNFICAGGDPKWSDPLLRLQDGDIILAYLKGKGYVGLGRVIQKRVKAIDFKVNKKNLTDFTDILVQKNIFKDSNVDALAQYCVGINWIKTVEKEDAIWEKRKDLFTTQLVVASMLNQLKTIQYLSKKFELDIFSLIDG